MTQAAAAVRQPNFPQRAEVEGCVEGPNFAAAHVGKFEDLGRYGVRHPLAQTIRGKVFLQQVLGLSAMEISFGALPGGQSIPFYHKHQQNEEVYLILSGGGQFQVDGQTFDVREGTAVRVSPDGVRCLRNTSADNMFYVVIQAKAGSLEQWTGTDGVGVPDEVTWPAA